MLLSRRRFAGCALCAALGLIAGEAGAQTTGLKRTILRRTDLTGTNYVNVLVRAEIAPGAIVARHTHPGIESSYLLSGRTTLQVAGQADQQMAEGDSFQIPPGVPHAARNGDATAIIIANYIVEKDKPLASPAPE